MPKQKNKNAPVPAASPSRLSRYLLPVTAALLLLVTVGIWLSLQGGPPVRPTPAPLTSSQPPMAPATALPDARMVDEQQCQGCHSAQVKDWQGSHHQLAMQAATTETVLGDFADVSVDLEQQKTRFFRRDQGFWVNTQGTDGAAADFKVAYTFGVAPLQQYLLEVPGGRLQALGVAWDTEKRRWFHLYPGQGVDFKNPLHWSKPSQNANFMCVECHTTGYQRNFDTASNTFASQWNSLGVGCQACHGPASNHLQWTAGKTDLIHKGFAVDLASKDTTVEIETCARCHARRAPLGDGYTVGKRLMDDYLPSVLTRELYALDGTIKDEVFEHGSFLQSKMFGKGVRCSDCHNPHSGELKAAGNGVCLQCHNPSGKSAVAGVDGRGLQAKDYDSPEHHRHQPGQSGTQCIDCHMPGKFYMGNDFRHDHSFSIPNPERARALGTPDACLSCHQGSAGDKITAQFKRWNDRSIPQAPRYGESLLLIRGGRPGAAEALYQQLQRSNLPAIQRATLLAELPSYPSEQALKLAARDLTHGEPQVRESALRAVSAFVPPAERAALLAPLLADPVKAVRISAARELLGASAAGLGSAQPAWNKAIGEYEQVQSNLGERAEANLNLAMLYQATGRGNQVEALLRTARLRDPDFLPALVTLMQWLEANGRGSEAGQLLDQALHEHPDAALLQHARGLTLIRAGDTAQAMVALRKAARLEPQNPQYGYVLAVALHDSGQVEAACAELETLLKHQPTQRNARLSLIQYYLENGHEPKAQALLQAWKLLNPGDPALK
ncbi:tetratricopeptide repeat protein [Pseudomonas gingeri]|uniref:tetratricopeptide repeat protein n=1 Tax=Pseudomonas gingeri TaxID=117681 RepID=UPI0015A44D61|nr:tetratricopeptide repeat protein [Pseudomonas gingeri]NWA02660.1 tetratricopeptide repeat protein [Pseudomonas gingeri]NWA12167.1 tetratricopeptide repeat protein [Pseudomonas gingeri]NWA57427.1 tetratricopeptide repeat protein [Pseudomonas gingeri]NWA93770.1 tetratricopeptide repeat protein [Pseudomonas gingeri]NWB03242.1 tetratricopeptide repeat protein [Pseudomonas gingeri]